MKRIRKNRSWKDRLGFTLIELLIVVAIIAILAAIAIPNFLQAQTRAKVSRALADMKTISNATEMYYTDYNQYPPNDWENFVADGQQAVSAYNVVPRQLSTPIAYLSSYRIYDPFAVGSDTLNPGADPEDAKLYTYYQFRTMSEVNNFDPIYKFTVLSYFLGLWVDDPSYNEGIINRFGKYAVLSLGPDNTIRGTDGAAPDFGVYIHYDPTNGTTSAGNIIVSPKEITQ